MSPHLPYTSPDQFLYIGRDQELRGIHGELGGDKVLEILEGAGIHTFGDLLDYARRKHFSDLPRIGAHGAETIRTSIQGVEAGNKAALEAKLHKTQQTLEQETDDKTKRR